MRGPQVARLVAAAATLCLFFAGGAQVAAASQACQFGKLDCPGGASFCAAPVCVCNPGFTGADCATKAEEGITASAFLRSSAAAAKFRSARGNNDSATERSPVDVHAPEAEACMDPPVCKNGGELDKTSCTCKCPAEFGGRDCSLCSSKPCADNLSRSPKTCSCVCALAIRPTGETWAPSDQDAGLGPCRNGGKFDSSNCRCGCEGAWTGPHCEVCLPQDCAHGGVWDDASCKCRCSGPWSAEDNCATCPVKQCVNGGKFDAATCSCRCPGRWKGELCDQCPAPQELAMAGISCGHRGFDRSKCDCRHDCPPIDCLHGGVQDPDTCACQCNRENIPTPSASAPVAPVVAEAEAEAEADDDNSTVTPVTVASLQEPAETASLLQAAGEWATAGGFGNAALLQTAAKQPEDSAQQNDAEASAAPAEQEGDAEPAVEQAEDAQDAPSEQPGAESAESADAVDTDVSPAEPAESSEDEAEQEASQRAGWVPAVPLAAAQVAVSPLSIAAFSQDTFWEGERCEVCQPPPDLQTRRTQPGPGRRGSYPFHIAPESCPKAHTFNMTGCACQPVCPPSMCQNGGLPVLLEASTPGHVGGAHVATEPHSEDAEAVIERGAFKCGCRCRPPWSGANCATRASGATPVSAARSCLAILRARPGAGSGRYWINPSGVAPLENAFEVFCDMNEDGGGWTEVARVGETLSTRLLDANSYTEGAAVGGGSEFVLPCGRLNGLDGGRDSLRRFVLRMSMGDVRDYFRAAPSAAADGTVDLATLCEVLSSHRKHLWSPFFRRSMLDGSEALLVTAADGQRRVVFDSAPQDAPDVVVVGSANATAQAKDMLSASGSAAEEESPVIVQSLDAAQFRQLRASAMGGKAAPAPAPASMAAHSDAVDSERAVQAAASVGETSMWAWRGGVAAPPNSAEAILQNVLHGGQTSSGQRFRQHSDRQQHLGRTSSAASVLNPDSAADRLLTALVGAPSSTSAERPLRRQALSEAANMRFAKTHAKAGASTDWKKFSWMLPPQGFSGPYGSPQVYNQFGGPSLPGPPVAMASEASLVSPLGNAQTHVLPMSKFSAMAQDKPDVYTVDGMNLPEAHPELTPGSPQVTSQAPSSEGCAQDSECSDSGPSVVVTVSAHGSRRSATQGQGGGQWQQQQAGGQSGPEGMSSDPRLAGHERPVVTTMGQLGAAMSRGTGGPDSLYGKMLPPMNANPQPVGWRSVAPSFGGLPRFVERRGRSASAQASKLHRSAAAPSGSGDPMESMTSKSPRVMSHDAQFRRQLAMGSLRPVLGAGITADDVPAWQARTAGSLAAAALLQAQAAGSAASGLGLSKYEARVALHAAAFLQAGARGGRSLQEEAEEAAEGSTDEDAPEEEMAEGSAEEAEGSTEEAEGSTEEAEGSSEEAEGGDTPAADAGAKVSVPAESGVAHNPSGWVRPAYIDTVMNPQFEGLLGGSRKGWPVEIDGRMYVSFWGGNRGGCCHASSQNHGGEPDQGGWAKEFRMHVIEVDPVLFAKGDDFDFSQSQAAAAEPRFKDENDPMEYV